MPGRHNVLNALAVLAVAYELEIPFQTIQGGFRNFGGLQRRFELRDEINNIMIIDDYGHHPAEIKATLSAAKSGWNKRTIAIFQPHRYTRTAALFEDFMTAFYQADLLVVTDVYAAGEEAIEGATGEALAGGIVKHGHKSVAYRASLDEVSEYVAEIVEPGDMVVTLGAGNVNQVCSLLADKLRNRVVQRMSCLSNQDMLKKKIGVLLGGLSAEREISLKTGSAALQALQQLGYSAVAIDVNRNLPQQLSEAGIEVAFIALHGRFGEDGRVQGLLEMLQIPYTGSGVLASSIAIDKVVTKQLLIYHDLPTPKFDFMRPGDLTSDLLKRNDCLPLVS